MKQIYFTLLFLITVLAAKAQLVASFDDLKPDPEKFWNGSDLSGSFKSGDFTFLNSYNSSWGSWSGFAYSNVTDNKTEGYANQYSAITGKGNNGSSNYAVCYSSEHSIVSLKNKSKISGVYVTNSTYAYFSMKNGDMFAKKFGGESGNEPDFFLLTAESIGDDGKPVDAVNFYLADFRNSDNSKDYIINKWTWFDLSGLKETNKIRFSLSSSDNSWGFMNTPGYFCIDDFNGEKPFDYKPVTFAGMENLLQKSESFYNGNDNKGGFLSGNFKFDTKYNADWGTWSGFAISNKTDIKTPGWQNQYSAITGKGVANTPSYAVAYPDPTSVITFKDTIISGLYVTNSTYAYMSMKNGDSFSKKFGGDTGNDEDWLILQIDGFDANNKKTGTVEFYLADFTYSININDYIIDFWKWIDLRKFGRISKLEFSLRSSDTGAWGINTPAYFCIDNLNYEVPTSAINSSINSKTSIFPNPFNESFSISGIKEKAAINVLDSNGKIIKSYLNNSNYVQINNLEFLNSGLYFVEIIEGNERTTHKIIKK